MIKKFRSTFIVLALATAGLVAIGSQPAAAASYTADLRVKGPGATAYTSSPYVSQVGSVGAILTYTLQVVNTGSTLAQYHIFVDSDVAVSMYDGALLLDPLTNSNDGYYTRPLAPGGTQVLTAKVKIPAPVDDVHVYSTLVYLEASDGTYIDEVGLFSNEAAPMPQSTSYDMYTKNGSQKPIGWSPNHTQILTAGTISATGTATFTVTLQNDGPTPASIWFLVTTAVECPTLTLTVKDGLVNVTSAVVAGTYHTPLLAHAAKKNLTVTMKSSSHGCDVGAWNIAASPDGVNYTPVDILIVNLTA